MTVIDLPASEIKVVRETHPSVVTWLKAVAFLVFCMILVGGATRLTDSGLSITEWQPLSGALPPLNEADWNVLFGKYKLTTEYQVQNAWMQLSDFKYIYWWEWGHRQLGRLIGLAFVLPLIYFVVRGRIANSLLLWLGVLLALGAAQGAMGWYMVQSGLSGKTDVSQYRLAAHLVLAALLLAALLWTAYGIGVRRAFPRTVNQWFSVLMLVLIFAQLAMGAFVAGLDAGQAANTWPKMAGAWVPDGLDVLQPAWRNVFENAMAVQFTHRMFAYALLALAMLHAWSAFNMPSMILAYAIFTQACIGIMVVLLNLGIGTALLHQAFAVIVLVLAVRNMHRQLTMPGPVPDPQ